MTFRRLPSPPWGLAVVLSLALAVSSAHAQDASAAEAEARALFEAGSVAFNQGRFEDALERFEQAYRLSHRPALLYNIATAADRAGRENVAVERYLAYLEALPDAPNRAFVEGRLRVLRPRVEAASQRPETAGEATAGDVAQDEGASPATGAVATPSTEAGRGSAMPEVGSAAGAGGGPDPTLPGLLFSVAGAAGVAAIVTGVLAWSARSELDLACPTRACANPALRDTAGRMEALAIATDVLAASSLAFAAGATLALVLAGGNESRETSVSLWLGPAGATLAGSF